MTTSFKYEEASAKGKGIICFLCLRSNDLNSRQVRLAALNLQSVDRWGSLEGSLVHLSLSVSRHVLFPVKSNRSCCDFLYVDFYWHLQEQR